MVRYLQFVNRETGDRDRKVDVTGKSECYVEKILSGMLRNIGPDWFVDDVVDDT